MSAYSLTRYVHGHHLERNLKFPPGSRAALASWNTLDDAVVALAARALALDAAYLAQGAAELAAAEAKASARKQ